jgi:hypothetical protein
MLRRVWGLRASMPSNDAERESFSIFSKLAGKQEASEVDKISDEIMTLSLKELQELSQALNDPAIIGKRTNEFPLQSSFPLPLTRSPFPHPKHVFAGVDSDRRPGMRNP